MAGHAATLRNNPLIGKLKQKILFTRPQPAPVTLIESMTIWVFALAVVALTAMAGYYSGGLRAAIAFLGLIIASVLAVPLSGPAGWLLSIVGLKHPVALAFLAPLAVWVVILVVFKAVAGAVHRKVDTYFRYKASETQKGVFERLNQRLGTSVGVANGALYVFVFCIIFYSVGYSTAQVEAAQRNGFIIAMVNMLARDVQNTGMDKVVAALAPVSAQYLDGADVVGDIYHNPLLQSRLAQYPAFLSLAERPEFTAMGSDLQFQEKVWLSQPRPPFKELINHDRVRPIAKEPAAFSTIWNLAKPDLRDLKVYLETGKSPKYGEEKILGRWEFDYRESFARARRAKPQMTLQDIRAARKIMSALNNSVFTALVDHKAVLKAAAGNKSQALQGTWQATSDGKYVASFSDGGRSLNVPVEIENGKLLLAKEGQTLVFEK